MKFFKKALLTLLTALGVILLALIVIVVALIFIKPFGIDVLKVPQAIINYGNGESTYNHPLLTTDQEVLLESVGVDTKSLPTQITPTQEACAIEALGHERVNEIKSGASPGLTDFLNARDCFE